MYSITKMVSLICLMVAVCSTSVMASAPGFQPEELSDQAGLGCMELAPSAVDLARDMLMQEMNNPRIKINNGTRASIKRLENILQLVQVPFQ